jgi:hypothetical protein
MRRTGGKLIAKWLAFWLAVGLGFFAVSVVPRWPLAAEPIVAHEAWQVLETSGSVRHQAPAGAYSWQAATGSEIPPGSRIVTEGGKVSQAGNKSLIALAVAAALSARRFRRQWAKLMITLRSACIHTPVLDGCGSAAPRGSGRPRHPATERLRHFRA